MRSTFIKIVLSLLVLIPEIALSLDTLDEEKKCKEIGFKKNTEAYGNCVLELIDRKKSESSISAVSNDADGQLCLRYGYKPNTNDFANCKLKIDQARADAASRQAAYDENKRQFDAQMAEYQRQKAIAANMALMQCGLNMMSGASCSGARVGPPPIAPRPLSPMTQTITMPSGRTVNCTTTGSITNCY
jgi:hypothetical protein